MNKMFSLLFAVMLLTSISLAQSNMSLGVGLTVLQPMGNFGDGYSTGFGGMVQGEMGFTGWKGVASIGYTHHSGKSLPGITYSLSNIPVFVGAEFTFFPNFYGKAQIGMNFLTMKADVTIGGVTYSGSSSASKFGYLVGVGYELKMIDISLQYQVIGQDDAGTTTFGGIGLNVLYKFGL